MNYWRGRCKNCGGVKSFMVGEFDNIEDCYEFAKEEARLLIQCSNCKKMTVFDLIAIDFDESVAKKEEIEGCMLGYEEEEMDKNISIEETMDSYMHRHHKELMRVYELLKEELKTIEFYRKRRSTLDCEVGQFNNNMTNLLGTLANIVIEISAIKNDIIKYETLVMGGCSE